MNKQWGTRVALLLVGIFVFFVWLQSNPPQKTGQQVTITIPNGASSQQISSILYENQLIRNPYLFRAIVKWGGHGAGLKAGTYTIEQGATLSDILNLLTSGKVKQEVVRFTIPEGLTLEQIADSLAKKGIVNRDKFLQETDKGDFDYDFIKQIPANQGIKHRLEGYLFPDTYEVRVGASEHDVLNVMLQQFGQVVTPEMQAQFQQHGLNLHQAVTMASLVEREARVPQERPTIAGVMYNRLQANPPMLLQIDATIQYILGQKPELTLQDLEADSPYNTYKRKGLPPGPIASPGKDALQAVASPAKHDYFYYVTKKDGSGEHYFGRTLEEHNRNIALSEQKK